MHVDITLNSATSKSPTLEFLYCLSMRRRQLLSERHAHAFQTQIKSWKSGHMHGPKIIACNVKSL